jgi:hypothetical protein
MGNIWVRLSSSLQLFLINHNNCITFPLTLPLLHILYAIDVLAYTISQPHNFLGRRQKLYGPVYAALGRIIIGEYAKCAELIQSPQRRGHYLGRAKLIPGRMTKNFPLFMSDADAGGDNMHATLHQHLWETLIPPAFKRLSDPVFHNYVQTAVARINMEEDDKASADTILVMVVRYVFHSIFGLILSDDQVGDIKTLIFGGSPFSSLVVGAMKPYSTPCGCFQGKRRRLVSSLTELVENSPALENYVPSDDTANMSKDEYAEWALTLSGIAGCLGTWNLCKQVLNGIPKTYPIDTSSKKELMLAVLEAARIKSPVNNVNIILSKDLTLMVNGKEYTFPPGTVVAASIGLSSVDPAEFPDPLKFNPKRSNLMTSSINFNHVGHNEVGAGKRQCPGRNIGMMLACDFLTELRKEYTPPNEGRVFA